MSWDRVEYDEIAACACGAGNVVRHCYEEDDDWNRSRDGVTGYDINCDKCKNCYHVDSITRYYLCPPWKGDGFVSHIYLVPNGMAIPQVMQPTYIQTYTLDAEIASMYDKAQINAVISDMNNSKYSTRVRLDDSRAIIALVYKRKRMKSLNRIIPILQDVVSRYDSYKWNPVTVAQFKADETKAIMENENKINEVIEKSFELHFCRK